MVRMRICGAFLTFILLIGASPAFADQSDPRLDRLFQQLAKATDAARSARRRARDCDPVAAFGKRHGRRADDAGQQSVEAQDAATAKKLFDDVTEMKPGYARFGISARALGRDGQPEEAARRFAESDRAEPRHFQALALAGKIAEDSGDKRTALATYRRAVAVDPQLEAIKRKISALAAEVEGKDI